MTHFLLEETSELSQQQVQLILETAGIIKNDMIRMILPGVQAVVIPGRCFLR